MHPSMDEFITYPEALKSTLIFSKTSTKISFFLTPYCVTGLFVATDMIDSGLIRFPILLVFGTISFLIIIGSFAMCGLTNSVDSN